MGVRGDVRALLRLGAVAAPVGARVVLAASARTVAELSALGLMATAAWLIARAAQAPPLEALGLAIVSVRAFALARGVFRYLERLVSHDAALRALAELRHRLFRALIPQLPGGRGTSRSGVSAARITSDAEAVQDLIVRCAIPALVAVVTSAAAIALAAVLLPVAGLVMAAGLLVGGAVVPFLAARAAHRTAARAGELADRLAEQQVDLLHGAADLAVFGATGRMLAEAERTGAGLARLRRAATSGTATAGAVGVLVQGVTTAAVTAVAIGAGADGVLVAVLALVALTAFEPVLPLAAAARRFVELGDAARRLLAVLDGGTGGAATRVPDGSVAGPVEVGVEDVVVRYPGAAEPALRISLRLPPGRRTVLVGASGAGKSTLLAVLLRFVDPEAGRVVVGDRDLRDLTDAELRRTVSGMTQDDHLFHASLRDNLTLARPGADEAELRAACGEAGLLDWIDGLPAGLDTVVGEDGARLSGGQRRRVSLARALLADPPVLLLDEPTEGLDPDMAEALMTDVLAATRNRTTLLVTHRPVGLDPSDRIVVLENGRVVPAGASAEPDGAPGIYRESLESTERSAPVG